MSGSTFWSAYRMLSYGEKKHMPALYQMTLGAHPVRSSRGTDLKDLDWCSVLASDWEMMFCK